MTTPDPWDDDRLTAAFTARGASAPVPSDLADDTMVALRRRPTRSAAPWLRPLPLAAAAAVVVSIVALSLAMSWRMESPPASNGPSAPVASGAAPSDALADTVLGLPVIDVPAALAVRDAGEDDRELAVRGWYSPIASLVPCLLMYVKKDSPVQPGCPDQWVVLMTEPALLSETRAAIGQWPVGDGFEVDLDGLDTSVLPSMPKVGPAEPAEIVVVGHFDDRRSRLCRPEIEQACRDRFVVDRIDQVAGEAQALSHVTMLEGEVPRSTLADVETAHAMAAPNATVLSVVTADNESIGTIEPTLVTDLTDLPDGSFYLPIRWVLRTLETGNPRTYVVTDGTDEVWVMDIDGNLVRVADASLTPPPTEGPWPPEGTTFTIRLTRNVDDRPPFEVAIMDRSGRLVRAREALEDDPVVAVPDDGTSAWVVAEPGDPRSIRLGWFGGNCDRHTIVMIDSLDSILLDLNVPSPCNVLGNDRSLILTYSEPVDAMAIDVSYNEVRGDAVVVDPPSSSAPAFRDGRLAVVGVDGGPGELSCGRTFPVSGLTAPTGAEGRVGPEFDALRAMMADPAYLDGVADATALTWREAGRTADTIVFLAEQPRNGDERFWVEIALRLDPAGWQFLGGGDCQPRAILPVGVGPATWIIDPAYPDPIAQDSTVHLLVTETACASGESAADRLAPAYVVASPYRIDITIGVHARPGGGRCPSNPPIAVEIDLGSPIDNRPLIDPNAPPPDGSSG